ncbi:MAG TPA: ABC transporter ATP-binding protein/permease [Candidatus Fournierella excrementavium]|nr:ABC transporter ATP-binding protein/permease [Candidatus Fournierella excrementavium]
MEHTAKKQGLLQRFWPYLKKYKRILVFDLFCAALTTLCDMVLPLIMRFLTNTATTDASLLTAGLVLRLGLIYLVLRIIDGLANYYMADMGHVMGVYVETDMRRDAFAHLQRLGYTYYSNTKVGQIMGRITNDLFDVTEFAHHCPEEFFIAAIKIAASFIILCQSSVALTLILFACVPLMGVVSTIINLKLRAAFRRQRVQIGELNARIEDSLLGERVVKAFANEAVEIEKFRRDNEAFKAIKKQTYRFMAAFQTSTRLFDGLMYLVVIVAGGLFLVSGRIAAGDLVAYMLYVTTLIATIRRIVEFAEQFQRGVTGIERFCEIMDAPIEITDAPDAKPLEVKAGAIRLENVSFEYPDDHNRVLRGVDLEIRPGEKLALVGPSGGGKTTLCNLIPRFYDVTGGRILIDGQDVRSVTLDSLRGAIGVVQQDVYLFSGSVYENIAYGKPGASRQEVEAAAKLAGAHEFITKLKDGYDTYVGERGVKLSGGQKQRISIARAFLKNPPIMILDEATSALDNESERLVQQSLEKLAKGRTTFTIAHRLTTIKNATVILVLTDKGIEEKGTHQELMAKKGIYYDLYNSYADDRPQQGREEGKA